jgi:hypothetical protein
MTQGNDVRAAACPILGAGEPINGSRVGIGGVILLSIA